MKSMVITIKTTDITSSTVPRGKTRNSTIMYHPTDEKFCLESIIIIIYKDFFPPQEGVVMPRAY